MRLSLKSFVQITLALLMTCLLVVLLIWQDARYRLVEDCHARGGQWDGPASRCRPIPKIFLERDLKRT